MGEMSHTHTHTQNKEYNQHESERNRRKKIRRARKFVCTAVADLLLLGCWWQGWLNSMRSHFSTTTTTAANNNRTLKKRDSNPATVDVCMACKQGMSILVVWKSVCARDFMCKKASSSELHVMTIIIIIKCRRRSKYTENSSIAGIGGLHVLNPFQCFLYNSSCTVHFQCDTNKQTRSHTLTHITCLWQKFLGKQQ